HAMDVVVFEEPQYVIVGGGLKDLIRVLQREGVVPHPTRKPCAGRGTCSSSLRFCRSKPPTADTESFGPGGRRPWAAPEPTASPGWPRAVRIPRLLQPRTLGPDGYENNLASSVFRSTSVVG